VIDLHCHILPEMDDGASDMAEAVEMARIAVKDGVSGIVAAPHIDGAIFENEDSEGRLSRVIHDKARELNLRLKAEKIPLTVFPGGEVSIFIPREMCKSFTVNRTSYLLIEFPRTHIPSNAREFLFSMMAAGLRPIISHPERNPSVIQNPKVLEDLTGGGALVQLTAGSLTGEYGPECRACALYLIRKKAVSFIASDGHGALRRPPVLSKAFEAVKKIAGSDMAKRLVSLNPKAVLHGKPIERV
jgi:protein-tyrosine phosphatase